MLQVTIIFAWVKNIFPKGSSGGNDNSGDDHSSSTENMEESEENKELVPYESTLETLAWKRKAERDHRRAGIRERLNERDKIAKSEFVESPKSDIEFFEIIRTPNIMTDSHLITNVNLMDDEEEVKKLVDKLRGSAENYFDYETDLFKFYGREDRSFSDLWKRPFTHADLEEENIEEKFPDDYRARALMVALNVVLQKNQWRHIRKKRWLQFGHTLPILALVLCWPYISSVIPPFLSNNFTFLPEDVFQVLQSILLFGLTTLVFVFLLNKSIRYMLGIITKLFTASNKNSFSVLLSNMASLNGRVRTSFVKLINDIEGTQDNRNMITRNEWPSKAKKIFEIAMWEAKRLEYLEKFWEIQFEKLRIFELVSDKVGNISSKVIAFVLMVIAVTTNVLLYAWYDWINIYELVAFSAISVAAIWYFGWLSRKDEYSFSLLDITQQGIEKQWTSFNATGYYERIAEQYQNGKAAKQLEITQRLRN